MRAAAGRSIGKPDPMSSRTTQACNRRDRWQDNRCLTSRILRVMSQIVQPTCSLDCHRHMKP